MPPVQIKIYCLDCEREFKGFQLKTTKAAQNHANREGHSLEAWRIPGGFLYSITSNRPRYSGNQPGY